MKTTFLKFGVAASLIAGLAIFALQPAYAVDCYLVRINPDRVTAVYNCDGKEVTVVRPVTVR